MRDAIKRAYAAKLEAEAKLQASAPAPAPAPATAITPPKAEKHWGSRDYPHPVRVAKVAPAAAKPKHVVSIPGRASYER